MFGTGITSFGISTSELNTYFAIYVVIGIIVFILFAILCLSNLSINSRLKEISDTLYKANKDKIDKVNQEKFREEVSSLKYTIEKEEKEDSNNQPQQAA